MAVIPKSASCSTLKAQRRKRICFLSLKAPGWFIQPFPQAYVEHLTCFLYYDLKFKLISRPHFLMKKTYEHKKLRNMKFPAHVRFHESLLIFPLSSVLAQSYFCGIHFSFLSKENFFSSTSKLFIPFPSSAFFTITGESHNCTELKSLSDYLLFFFDNQLLKRWSQKCFWKLLKTAVRVNKSNVKF